MNLVSLFSGIGGLEHGFHSLGLTTSLFCENDPAAQKILSHHYPGCSLAPDVQALRAIPKCDILLAGFPCQDLSQAGTKVGISGTRSGLVTDMFRLISKARPRPPWVVVENVPYMLSLDSGAAMHLLTSSFEALGYRWCYRTVDARGFGLPQRRPRVLFVASRKEDPRDVLLSESVEPGELDGKPSEINKNLRYGFYWTEGKRGVGWTREGVPPIKGGSTIGIPSPPAVWIPRKDFFGTISLRDSERLQGFPPDWTLPADTLGVSTRNARWRLVGNAVNTRASRWLAESFISPKRYDPMHDVEWTGGRWPSAAWGAKGKVYRSQATTWPRSVQLPTLAEFLTEPLKPLSPRATLGFLSRAIQCTNVVYSSLFLESLQRHATAQTLILAR
jgi:DNA (cytosine-5)-methyltransferase 1